MRFQPPLESVHGNGNSFVYAGNGKVWIWCGGVLIFAILAVLSTLSDVGEGLGWTP